MVIGGVSLGVDRDVRRRGGGKQRSCLHDGFDGLEAGNASEMCNHWSGCWLFQFALAVLYAGFDQEDGTSTASNLSKTCLTLVDARAT